MFDTQTPPPGSRPGTLAIPADASPTRIRVMDIGSEVLREAEVEEPEELRAYFDSPETAWVDVQGFADEAVLRKLGDVFGLHLLTLEDATNVPQRAKSQPGRDYHLVVARLPFRSAEGQLETPQVCFVLGPNWLVTFQDHYLGIFEPIRERLRAAPGRPIRRLGPAYLMYAMLDALVDYYFPVVEEISRELEDIEEGIYADRSDVLAPLHRLRRELVVIRRIGWPEREALRALVSQPSDFLTEESLVFLRSVDQHIAQVMEAADAARDSATSLVEIHLAMIGQRTNEVMMVLTLMASIFIPLTFVAGIYGMNFESMPELNSRYGYPSVLVVMVGTALGMIAYFRHRGWLGGKGRKGEDD